MPKRDASRARTPRGARSSSRGRHGTIRAGIAAGIISGLVVLGAQAFVDGWRTSEAERRENLRFVRELVVNDQIKSVSLRGIDLQGRDLSGLVLGDVEWPGADMSDSTLRGLSMSAADLTGVDFSESDMYEANLAGAAMTRADLSGTNLQNVDLSEAHIVHSDLSGANLDQTNLAGARLGNSNLENSKMLNVELADADLNNVNLSNAELSGFTASLSTIEPDYIPLGPNLRNADLSGSTVQIDLRGSKLENTKLYGADLTHARLPIGEGLIDLKMLIRVDEGFMPAEGELDAGIESICYDRHTKWPADFPLDSLPELQCDEMRESPSSAEDQLSELLNGATP